MVPWRQLRYVMYAREFGWTPDQVDQLRLIDEPYLLPINTAFEGEIARRQEQANLDAEREASRRR